MQKHCPYSDPDYMKKWRERNKEKLKKDRRNWYLSHKEQEKERAVKWQKANPRKTTASWKAQSAMKRYPGKITMKQVEVVISCSKSTCYWCGKSNLRGRDLTLEHLERNNDITSLTVACLSCNAKRLHNK